MKLYYDLHIHSALSPCGDVDMTPNNIVNMAIIKGLDVIAVTDHNSCGNVRAVMEVAGDRILVIPGMEIETSEEVHVVCYFKDIKSCEDMWEEIKNNMNVVKNDEKIYGKQCYMNSDDEIVGYEENLLVTATNLNIYEVTELAKKYGGVAVLAHIDRTSFSVISNLGFIPPDLDITAVEITSKNLESLKDEYKKYNIITNSDAHYLENILEPEFYIEVLSKTTEEVIRKLCKTE